MLCLRALRDRAQAPRTRWLQIGFAASVLSVCSVLLAVHSLRTSAAAEPGAVAPLATVAAPPNPIAEANIERAAVALPAVDQAENQPNPPSAPVVPTPSAISSVLVPAPSGERAPSARTPSSSELLAALHATPVSMFSTSWCRHCERARRFFRQNGVSVVERDIDVDARAAAELVRRSGSKAVPLIDVDGRELRGFDERATIEAVVASVERRLGVTGLKLSVASVSERGS